MLGKSSQSTGFRAHRVRHEKLKHFEKKNSRKASSGVILGHFLRWARNPVDCDDLPSTNLMFPFFALVYVFGGSEILRSADLLFIATG